MPDVSSFTMKSQSRAGRIPQLQYFLLPYVGQILRSSKANFLECRHGEVHPRSLKPRYRRPRTTGEEARRRAGGPVKRGMEEREDRPNAVTPITLRLPREHRICQVTITSYTRWPFLNRRSALPRMGHVLHPKSAHNRVLCATAAGSIRDVLRCFGVGLMVPTKTTL